MTTKIKKGKKFNLFLTEEEHRKVKVKSALQGVTMQEYIVNLICDNDKDEDDEWNNFIKAHDNAPEEEPTPEDIEAIERGRREIEAGEVQDFEDAIREIENES
jgi:hypothetical protein